ncbi:MAG: bifunctional diaminohydroxyphosphoribosylaminopyrimidine deaminase/5-amino-6-(5-phosphoribosylamino)uracil reductase RibD [Acidithiobacillus sp.]
MTKTDEDFMALALALAERGLWNTDPNPRVGAVVVQDGAVVGQGWHRQAGGPHAEVFALAEAGDQAQGATVYLTLEPCSHHGRTPPCADALIAAGVGRVVVALRDPNPLVAGQGLERLRAAGVAVTEGVLAEAAAALNPGFLQRMTRGMPWVRLKQAMSLDGRVALANGVSQWLTGEAARADVQRERARASAIVVGVGTVLRDDPRLAPRLGEDLQRYPVKVVLDSRLRTPSTARLFQTPGTVWICHGPQAPEDNMRPLQAAGATLLAAPPAAEGLDLLAVLRILAAREINECLVEAGPTLAGALLAAGLVSEWLLYVAPKVLGHDAQPVARLGPFTALEQVPQWRIKASIQLDADLKLLLHPKENA